MAGVQYPVRQQSPEESLATSPRLSAAYASGLSCAMAAPENSTGKTTAPSKSFFVTVFFMLCPFLEKTAIQNQIIPLGHANNKQSHFIWHGALLHIRVSIMYSYICSCQIMLLHSA